MAESGGGEKLLRPHYQHHGATRGVTGSCHRYEATAETHLLVDCGLFQGEDAREDSFARHQIEFDISQVVALLVTHVHIDHIGRLPYLMAAGFDGPIICSEPSARLLPLVIEDALKVGFTRDRVLISRFLETVEKHLVPLAYKTWHMVTENDELLLRVRLQRAGHILGSAYVEVDAYYKAEDRHDRTVYSGDLGAPYAPLLPAPRSPHAADTLIIESTYGNRLHENRRERRQRLKQVLQRALANRGTVMIPAFSIGRTQELLYELEGLIHADTADWGSLQIIVDSPLAARFTAVYRELKPFWDAEAQQRVRAGRHPLSFENLYTVDSHDEHIQTVDYLARTRQPAVVIAASGMAAGGRIVNYLKAMLPDPLHDVLFVGYQASGTPGAQLQALERRRRSAEHVNNKYDAQNDTREKGSEEPGAGADHSIMLDGERVAVRAGIHTIGGYSAHADQHDLVNFVRRMRRWPDHIRIVHGDDAAKAALRDALQTLYRENKHKPDGQVKIPSDVNIVIAN